MKHVYIICTICVSILTIRGRGRDGMLIMMWWSAKIAFFVVFLYMLYEMLIDSDLCAVAGVEIMEESKKEHELGLELLWQEECCWWCWYWWGLKWIVWGIMESVAILLLDSSSSSSYSSWSLPLFPVWFSILLIFLPAFYFSFFVFLSSAAAFDSLRVSRDRETREERERERRRRWWCFLLSALLLLLLLLCLSVCLRVCSSFCSCSEGSKTWPSQTMTDRQGKEGV